MRPSDNRVYYVAPVSGYRSQEVVDIPAVRNKVFGVCSALRAAGARTWMVSALPSRGLSPTAKRHRVNGCGVLRPWIVGRGSLRRLTALFSLWWTFVLLPRGKDKIILYNFFPEYLLLALWMRMMGTPCTMDCEDAPWEGQSGGLAWANRISFVILRRLCSDHVLTASHAIADKANLRHYLPVYGVASFFDKRDELRTLFSSPETRIGFGGAMMPETGTELFSQAVRLVARASTRQMTFFVTGMYSASMFQDLADEVNASSATRLVLLPGLGMQDYAELSRSLDIGLCLKLPTSHIGQTTFPSKVIEIAAMGTLLCTTAVSDVPLIFDEASAIILTSETGEELADALINAAADRERSAAIARNGRKVVLERFSATSVGRDIRRFLERAAAA